VRWNWRVSEMIIIYGKLLIYCILRELQNTFSVLSKLEISTDFSFNPLYLVAISNLGNFWQNLK
jgi:hypothetical protein